MRNAPDLDPRMLAQPHGVGCRVRSFRGGRVLAENIPVVGGSLTATDGQQIPERLTLDVPVRDRGVVWEPRDPRDPLNNFGQRLEVAYVIPRAGAADIEIPLGVFRVQAWNATRDLVSVEATGLLDVVAESKLLAPFSPRTTRNHRWAINRLLAAHLPIEYAGDLPPDDQLGQVLVWDEDRLGGILELFESWGVRGQVNADGVLTVTRPPTRSTPPITRWHDGNDGTVVSAPRSGSRDSIYNAVIVRSTNADLDDYGRLLAQAAAYVDNAASPLRWGGPYGRVPYFHDSPTAKTKAGALRQARQMLVKLTRWAETRVVTAIPDPRIELGDIATVVTREVSGIVETTGEVVAYQLPLTADGGAAQYTVSATGVIF